MNIRNYAFIRVEEFSVDLRDKIEKYPGSYLPDTIAKLEEIRIIADACASLMRAAEYLYSGDYSEESFHEQVDEIIDSIPESGVSPDASLSPPG